MPETLPQAVISSTGFKQPNLANHRHAVEQACLESRYFPLMYEHRPASPDDVISYSFDLIDQADVYVGFITRKYGTTPEGYDKSLVHLEYERAVGRNVPILIFLISDEHPPIDGEPGSDRDAENLSRFRHQLVPPVAQHTPQHFNSPEDLKHKVARALEELRPTLVEHDTPLPPQPFISQRYSLMRTANLIGRHNELDRLTKWISSPQDFADARIFLLIAIGGMGKSALTWHWFNTIVPHRLQGFRRRIWWSFYGMDASFDGFIIRALAYVSGKRLIEINEMLYADRERLLLEELNSQPTIVVLDGVERLLKSYTRMDAANLPDDAEAPAQNGLTGRSNLVDTTLADRRKVADIRVGEFLRRLCSNQQSRVLITSRLPLADLELPGGGPLPGCYERKLRGLTNADALALWDALGARGAPRKLQDFLRRLDNHPLLIQVLAGLIKRCPTANGDFDVWLERNPEFNLGS